MKKSIVHYNVDKGRAVFIGTRKEIREKMDELGGAVNFAYDSVELPETEDGGELLDFVEAYHAS